MLEAMPEIVQPHAFEPRRFRDGRPRLFKIGARGCVLHAGDNVGVGFEAGQACEHLYCRRAQIDRLPARLAIREKENAAFEIGVLPLGV
jgi:hypothetical protein